MSGSGLRRKARATTAAMLITLAALLAASTANAVVWRNDKPAELAFEHVKQFDGAVGRVARGGAATLIAPLWAITAAHVAQRLTPGDLVRFGDADHAIDAVFIHPLGQPDPAHPNSPPEVDLALIRLARPVQTEWTFWPYQGRDEVGKVVVIAGFGDHGPAGGPLQREDGRLRAVENQVADAGPLRLFVPFDAPPAGLLYEGIGGPGDSGGPLVNFVDEEGFHAHRLLGVSSGAEGPPGAYGTVDVYTRISTQMDWIESVAGVFREVAIEKRVAPRWPREALVSGAQGAVLVRAMIDAEGVPTKVEIIASKPAKVFDSSAIAAFKKWRFKPRIRAGVATPREVVQRFDFQLTN